MSASPFRSFMHTSNSLALERSLTLNKNRKDIRKSILWGTINLILLAVLLFDVCYSCPLYFNYYDYVEYALICIVAVNFLYYAASIVVKLLSQEQVPITLEQKKLLNISDGDPNFKIVDSLASTPPRQSFSQTLGSATSSLNSTPMDFTATSWRSASFSPNDSLNYSLSSPSWTYHKGSPANKSLTSGSPDTLQYRDTSGIEFISNESDLEHYLKEFEMNTSLKNLSNQSQQPSNLLNSFWSHPITKTAKDMSAFLRNSVYQLSSQSTKYQGSSGSTPTKMESNSSPIQSAALLPWAKINVDIHTLTQWNENLRKWISQTILDRLVKEFDFVNESFEAQGFLDIKIGTVGLDRLRKTAQVAHVAQLIPSLPTLIPFLEICTNQEYLEKRIRELTKGGCMSDFRWNGGSGYNGKDWDDSLPTDSEIIMHLIASYLDTQLVPLPNMPDTKPFSGLHYIKCKDKMPPLTPNSLFIQQVTENPPHYRVVVGETIYEMVKGYSNLFYSILFFLYHVNKKEHGMLGRVTLGRAGINMLWIIE